MDKAGPGPSAGLPPAANASKPHALHDWASVARTLRGRRLAVFLDYDGTLSKIVANPEEAVLTKDMRAVIQRLSHRFPTAIVTGRKIETIKNFVQLDEIFYAASHGFHLEGPDQLTRQVAEQHLPELQAFRDSISALVEDVAGCTVEDNTFCISVHYRNVQQENVASVNAAVDACVGRRKGLVRKSGRLVYEVRPDFDWDKGKAVAWMLQHVFLPDESMAGGGFNPKRPKRLEQGEASADSVGELSPSSELYPIYIGDDTTDEDVFRYFRSINQGLGVFVRSTEAKWSTAASYVVDSVEEVQEFLEHLSQLGEAN